jgi:hypothetical protein
MQFEVHVSREPVVIFIPCVGSSLVAQTSIKDNGTTKVPAASIMNATMKAEDWSMHLHMF